MRFLKNPAAAFYKKYKTFCLFIVSGHARPHTDTSDCFRVLLAFPGFKRSEGAYNRKKSTPFA